MTTQLYKRTWALGLLGLLLFAAQAQAASFLYIQNPDFSGNAYASQNDPTTYGNFATSYDNFTLGSTSTVNEAEWIGQYFNPPVQGPITSWNVSFYSDNGGQPGTVLDSVNISGNGNESSIGGGFFLYDVSLSTPFTAQAGTQYWMSVVPTLSFPPQWGWSTSYQGDGQFYQDYFGTRSQVPGDLTFALLGNPAATPEPASLTLFGLGGLGMMWHARRRRKAIARS